MARGYKLFLRLHTIEAEEDTSQRGRSGKFDKLSSNMDKKSNFVCLDSFFFFILLLSRYWRYLVVIFKALRFDFCGIETQTSNFECGNIFQFPLVIPSVAIFSAFDWNFCHLDWLLMQSCYSKLEQNSSSFIITYYGIEVIMNGLNIIHNQFFPSIPHWIDGVHYFPVH